jgi:hypothetical protein
MRIPSASRSRKFLESTAPKYDAGVRRLLTVEDTFAMSGRGLMIAPMPARHELRGPGDITVELRLPDGTRREARLSVLHEDLYPTPAIRRWACLFRDLGKTEVPIGTEIWCDEAAFMPTLRTAR